MNEPKCKILVLSLQSNVCNHNHALQQQSGISQPPSQYHANLVVIFRGSKSFQQPLAACWHHIHRSPSSPQSSSRIAPSPGRQSNPLRRASSTNCTWPCPVFHLSARIFENFRLLKSYLEIEHARCSSLSEDLSSGDLVEPYSHQSRSKLQSADILIYHRSPRDLRSRAQKSTSWNR